MPPSVQKSMFRCKMPVSPVNVCQIKKESKPIKQATFNVTLIFLILCLSVAPFTTLQSTLTYYASFTIFIFLGYYWTMGDNYADELQITVYILLTYFLCLFLPYLMAFSYYCSIFRMEHILQTFKQSS